MDSNPFSNSSILSALQDTLKLHSNRVGTAIFPHWREATWLEEIAPLRSKDLTLFTQRLGRMERERLATAQAWTNSAVK
jgi:hypothetical protein